MKHLLITTIVVLLLAGCALTKSYNLSAVSIGMDKQAVVSLHGEPFRVAAMDGSEYFITEALIRSSLNLMDSWSMKLLSDSKMAR